MKRIYKADIHQVYVKDLQLDSQNITRVALGTAVVQKDELFYKNFFGRIVSFKYHCLLATEEEARIFVTNHAKKYCQAPSKIDCIYVDYNAVKPDCLVSNKDFKKIKTKFKNKRNSD